MSVDSRCGVEQRSGPTDATPQARHLCVRQRLYDERRLTRTAQRAHDGVKPVAARVDARGTDCPLQAGGQSAPPRSSETQGANGGSRRVAEPARAYGVGSGWSPTATGGLGQPMMAYRYTPRVPREGRCGS